MVHVLPVADRIVLLELGRVVRVIDRGEVDAQELADLVAASRDHEEVSSRRPTRRN
jgi:ABC-type uncharacterized transport system ATPase subunit